MWRTYFIQYHHNYRCCVSTSSRPCATMAFWNKWLDAKRTAKEASTRFSPGGVLNDQRGQPLVTLCAEGQRAQVIVHASPVVVCGRLQVLSSQVLAWWQGYGMHYQSLSSGGFSSSAWALLNYKLYQTLFLLAKAVWLPETNWLGCMSLSSTYNGTYNCRQLLTEEERSSHSPIEVERALDRLSTRGVTD